MWIITPFKEGYLIEETKQLQAEPHKTHRFPEKKKKNLAAQKIEADVRCKQLWPGKFNKIPIFKLLLWIKTA